MSVSKSEFIDLVARFRERAWAHLLQLRHERGDTLNRNQVRCYRNALGLNTPAQ